MKVLLLHVLTSISYRLESRQQSWPLKIDLNRMKSWGLFFVLLFSLAGLLNPAKSMAQTTIVGWDGPAMSYQIYDPVNGIFRNPYANTGINGNVGISIMQTFGGVSHASASSWYDNNNQVIFNDNTEPGNWSNGSGTKGWIFSFKTTGYNTLKFSGKMAGSYDPGLFWSGPRDFKLQYSLNNSSWTDVSGGTIAAAPDNQTAYPNLSSLSNVSLPAACENQNIVYLRMIMTSNITVNGSIVGEGNSILDDFMVVGTAIVVAPTVTTSSVIVKGAITATLGGAVNSDGGGTITERGIVLATTTNPTTSDNKVSMGTGVGTYSALVSSLTPSTLYYFRAYAINSAGTSYGAEFSFTTNASLSATSSFTNVSCFGGSNGTATVAVSGGRTPYSYSWSPSGGTAATAIGLAAGTYTCTITDAENSSILKSVTITQPATSISSTTSQTNISCFGGNNGSAAVSVSGGTAPYTYSWSPSGGTGATATNLAAGNYICTITDANSCQSTQSFTITQPTQLSVATAQTNIACNGGTTGEAAVSVSGGTAPYTYSWSPSGGTGATATNLAAGTYTCTITDANSCTTTKTFTIVQPSQLTATTAQTNVSCNGGSNGVASVTASGGAGGYTYSWAPSGGTAATATGLAAGSYTCTITDANSCTITKSFSITQPPVLIANAVSQTNVSCNGGSNGSASVSVTGGSGGYTYTWVPSGGTAATATGLTAGTYNCIVTDGNGCTTTRSFTITQPTALIATTSQTNISCNGGSNGVASVSVSGGVGGYTYSWAPSGGTAATATGLTAGTYFCTITDANSCTTTKTFTITQPPALIATTSQTNISCNGGSNGSASVSVSGGAGGYTYLWSPSGGTAATANALTAGAYSCTITDANNCTITKNFTLIEPAALTADLSSQTNVSCNGGSNGSATITVGGGTAPYSYMWTPSGGTAATASGLTAGTYTCTVTDFNGCLTTQSFTITEPTVLSATISKTNVSCNGCANGSASVSVSGGTGAYTYLWSPSGGTAATASGLAPGSYSCLITDSNNCTITQSATIQSPPAITSTPSLSVPYGTLYQYSAIATKEGALETTISAPTKPDWLTFNANGPSQATRFGNISAGINLSATAEDNEGNLYAILFNGTTIYKISPNGNSTIWKSGLISGNVYSLHISNGYLYVPRYFNSTQSITRIPLNNPSALEETFATMPYGALSLTDKDGWIYASEFASRQISRINETTKERQVLLTAANGIPSNGVIGLTFGKDNNLYIATYGNGSIIKYDGTSVTTVLTGLPNAVTSIKQDRLGNFYISLEGGEVRKYSNDFSSFELLSSTSPGYILSLYISGSDNLSYVHFNTNEVYRLQAGGQLSGTPAKKDLGEHQVVLRATNDAGYTDQIFTITVEDKTPPVITTLIPADNAIDVSLQPSLSITFDEEISLSTVGTFILKNGPTVLKTFDLSVPNDRNSFTLSADKLTLSVNISSNLPVITNVGVEISAGFVKDIYNNSFAGITAASGLWNFTTVDKVNQIITFQPIPTKTYGDASFTLGNLTTDKGLTVTYTAADPSIVAITGNQATILKAGTTKITATQPGDETRFAAPPVEQTLQINKAMLTVTADDKIKIYDSPVPVLTYKYTGWKNGENASVIDIAPIMTTTVTVATFVGDYPGSIIGSGGVDNNYDFTYVPGNFKVAKCNQEITFASVLPKTYGDANFGLVATTNTGLKVSFLSSNPKVATISGTNVTIVGAGTTTITAVQEGTNNFNAAPPVARTLTVNPKSLNVEGVIASSKIYDGNAITNIQGAALSGVIGTDVVLLENASKGNFAQVNVGSVIPVSTSMTLSGENAGNYTLIQPAGLKADITKKVISVSAVDQSKDCNQADPILTYNYSPDLVGQDVFTGLLTRQPGNATGNYKIQLGSLSLSNNYDLVFKEATFSILHGAPVWVTAPLALNVTVEYNDAAGLVAAQKLAPIASDVCDNQAMLPVKISGLFEKNSQCDLTGRYVNTWTVKDHAGNSSEVYTQVITIVDRQAPIIEKLPSVIFNVNPGVCKTAITYPEFTFDEACVDKVELISGLGKSGLFPLGTTLEKWKVTDKSGNSSYIDFAVTIRTHNEAPLINQVANLTVLKNTKEVEIQLSGIDPTSGCSPQEIVSLNVAANNKGLIPETLLDYTKGSNVGKLILKVAPNMIGEAIITVTVKDNGGTENSGSDTRVMTFKINVDSPSFTNIVEQGSFATAYPNPTRGIVTIDGLPLRGNTTIAVYSIDGQLIMKKTCNTTTDKVDLSNLVPGMYLLKVNNQSIKIKKE